MTNLLHINSSARFADSASRELSSRLVDRLREQFGDVEITTRDLAAGLPLYTEATLLAVFTPDEHRTPEQRELLATSDQLISELAAADVLVIGLPIYNFGPPAPMKAWADLVARVGITFEYTETGPRGLLANKPAYIVVASGGVPIGSPMDFSSTWLTGFLGFLGISDVTIVEAGELNMDPENALAAARTRIDEVPLPATAA